MSISQIIIAAAVVGGLGLFIGIFLGIFGEKFKVEINEKEQQIRKVLPGNNCGGCGYTGCDALAAAICASEAPVSSCPVGGSSTASAIADIMGIAAQESVHLTAFVACAGTCDKTTERYEYNGIYDCQAVSSVAGGGPKSCIYGCLGYASCVKVCPYDAIHLQNGVAVVDKDACKACGKCVAICPKHLITLEPYDAHHLVRCASKDKGSIVSMNCTAGCIGCHLCEKNCPVHAISVTDNLAHIDTGLCIQCSKCASTCPKGIITGI